MTTTDTDRPWRTTEIHLADAANQGPHLVQHLEALLLFTRPVLEMGWDEAALLHAKWMAEQTLQVAEWCVRDVQQIIEDLQALHDGREVTI